MNSKREKREIGHRTTPEHAKDFKLFCSSSYSLAPDQQKLEQKYTLQDFSVPSHLDYFLMMVGVEWWNGGPILKYPWHSNTHFFKKE